MECKYRLTIAAAIAFSGLGVYWWRGAGVAAGTDHMSFESEALPEASIRPLQLPKNLDMEKAQLGKILFMDVRLSHNNRVSCHSCHDFTKGGTDNLKFSVGINGTVGTINAPSVFNSGFNFKQFWNGRAEDLTQQISGPIENPDEMGSNWPEVVAKLSEDPEMSARFIAVFQRPPSANNIQGAITEFERALVTMNAPFDRYLRGESGALSESQIRGYKRFTQYGCISCHQGQNVGGNMFQQMGLAHDYFLERGGQLESDGGRFNVTKVEGDRHVFKVPSLRNVALTAPYFHDGSEPKLEGAIRKMARYQLGRVLPDADVRDIVEFLKSLTGETPAILGGTSHAIAKK